MTAAPSQTFQIDAPTLLTGTVLENGEYTPPCKKQENIGIWRATKNQQALSECAHLINQGGLAAIVPSHASSKYVAAVYEQIQAAIRTKDRRTLPARKGMLALPTSGSTGKPKLVIIPDAAIEQFINWARQYFEFNQSTISLNLSPWNFDVTLLDTWAVLAAGGTVIAANPGKINLKDYLAGLVNRNKPTFIQTVPSTLAALVNGMDKPIKTSNLHVVLTGGVAPLPLRKTAEKRFPNATFHYIYGSTEVNDCLINSLTASEFSSTDPLPLGLPISGCEISLKVDDTIKPIESLETDTTGEIHAQSPWMATGYLANGQLNNLPLSKQGLYPTGDLATLTKNGLMYQGRIDRTIKLRDQRINLETVEQAALKSGKAEMAYAWVDNSASNELHLAYTPAASEQDCRSSLNLRLAMSSKLPPYAMPTHFHKFNSTLPLSANGKPDRRQIENQAKGQQL